MRGAKVFLGASLLLTTTTPTRADCAWMLWTFPSSHPSQAKPTGDYYVTQEQCQSASNELFWTMRRKQDRLMADPNWAKKPETVQAVEAKFVYPTCTPSNISRDIAIQGFREQYGEQRSVWQVTWDEFRQALRDKFGSQNRC